MERARDEIDKLYKFKSNLFSTISHELRAPISPIKEGAGILLDGMVGDITLPQKDLLDIIKRNAERLNSLINDVLDYQKLEAGKMVFNFEDGDISAEIDDVYNTLKIIADKRGLKFKIEKDDHLPRIKYDRNKIGQVLTNLVGNAIKFTESGTITVRAEREAFSDKNLPAGVRVSVIDTGGGIRDDDIPRLFTSFSQLENAHLTKKVGTGLGLAISKEIITNHSGRIWVESELGKGSKFIFVLPG